MPRSGPDGNVSAFAYAAQAVDPALIYQMLWGFAPVDGLGRIWYLDTWNNGTAGVGITIGGAALNPVVISGSFTRLIYVPPNTIKLSPGTIVNDLSQVFREYYLGTNTRLGAEAAFVFADAVPNYEIIIDYRINASKKFAPRLRWSHGDGQWQIRMPDASWQNIYNSGVPPSGSIQHIQVKFVGDWSTGKYVRALIGDNLINLSQYDMPVSANSYDGYVITSFGARSYGAGTADGYLGYILNTKDEPP